MSNSTLTSTAPALSPYSPFTLFVDGLFVSLAIVILLIASYRSYLARRVLRRPVYRSHALWTTLIGAAISYWLVPTAYFDLTGTVLIGQSQLSGAPNSANLLVAVVYLVTTAPFLVVLWAWIDQSIEVAFDMDFLHSDTLSWRRGMRWVAWTTILAVVALGLLVPGDALLPSAILYLGFAVLFAYAASVLFLSARKVKDVAMKSYVKWVGVLVAWFVVVVTTWPYYGVFVVTAYALYRASGSFTKTSPLEVNPTKG